MLGVKSVKQRYQPSGEIQRLLETFRRMVNESLQIGLSYDACSLKRLSCLSYRLLRQYDSPSYYKLCAISRAAGILSARKKSLRRGIRTRDPYSLKPVLTAYHGFKVQDGELRIPVGQRRFQAIRLTNHTASVLSDKSLRVRSFTLTGSFLSLCISKEVREVDCTGTVGVDRNLRNLTVGNEHRTVRYDLSRIVRISETTSKIVGSFKRNDVRVRRVIASKYGRRRRERTQRLLHNVTRQIVTGALRDKQAIVLESIEGIRRLYRRGNGQGRRFRRRMNGWSFSEAQHQIIYKSTMDRSARCASE